MMKRVGGALFFSASSLVLMHELEKTAGCNEKYF
jgi:hypothetical protein